MAGVQLTLGFSTSRRQSCVVGAGVWYFRNFAVLKVSMSIIHLFPWVYLSVFVRSWAVYSNPLGPVVRKRVKS